MEGDRKMRRERERQREKRSEKHVAVGVKNNNKTLCGWDI